MGLAEVRRKPSLWWMTIRYCARGFALLINREQDLMVCGEAEESSNRHDGDRPKKTETILIADISLNGPDGLDLLKNLRTQYPNLPVLILSMHDESIYAERALRARANGYIMKQEATEKVLVAVRRILGGGHLPQRSHGQQAASRVHQRYCPADIEAQLSALSDRELEVFRLIGEGRGTRQIAEKLHLSIKTVETYQAHIKEKLSLQSGRELVPTRHPGEHQRQNNLTVAPLRYALSNTFPGMVLRFSQPASNVNGSHPLPANDLSSRPERSAVEGPAVRLTRR